MVDEAFFHICSCKIENNQYSVFINKILVASAQNSKVTVPPLCIFLDLKYI